MRAASPFLVALVLLAGCSDGAGGPDPQDPSVPTLDPTAGKGVIRSVVVDEAIRPLAGANVTVLSGGDALRSLVTDESGFAGFADLDPGTYFVQVRKLGYVEARQSVDVVADVADPPVVKLQMAAFVGDLPFVAEYKLEAFLECSASAGNWCFIANYYPCLVMTTAGQPCTGNLTNDNSFFPIPLQAGRVPDHLQGEMVWESTQAAFTYMNWRFDIDDPATPTLDYTPGATGPSPLLVVVDPEEMEDYGLTVNSTLSVEAFHAGSPAVCDNDPTGDTLCVYSGAAVQQRFAYIIHAFYGYTPPEGWRFSATGAAPQPQ
jgi:hypothetical protein